MSSVEQVRTGHVPISAGILLPASMASEEPAELSRRDQSSISGIQWKDSDKQRSDWNDSCNTTIRDTDSAVPDLAFNKTPSLFPPPDEVDENSLSGGSERSSMPLPQPSKEPQISRSRVYTQRHDILENTRKVQEGCDAVLGTRLKAHERRSILRRDRHALSDLEARLQQELRNILLTSQNEKFGPLLELCEQMQTLRDEFSPREDDYDILEDQLNTREFELEETAAKLLQLLDSEDNGLLGENDVDSVPNEDVADVERVSVERGSFQRPEVQEYLSHLGDRDIIEERLTELRHERATLVEEEKSRARFDMVLSEDGQRFLDSFDVRHQELQEALTNVENDLTRSSKRLDQTDSLLFATTRFDGLDDVAEFNPNEVRPLDLNSVHSAISHPDIAQSSAIQRSLTVDAPVPPNFRTDPLLLAVNETKPTFNHFVGAERKSLTSLHHINAWLLNQQGIMSADEFLNKWLLSVLRTSLTEINRYISAPSLQGLNIGQEGLRNLVLEWWYKDAAAGQYLKTLRLEARGMSLSVSAALSTRDVQSDTMAATLNQLSTRLYRNHTTLETGEPVLLTIRRARST